jgi:hypothetical protein
MLNVLLCPKRGIANPRVFAKRRPNLCYAQNQRLLMPKLTLLSGSARPNKIQI